MYGYYLIIEVVHERGITVHVLRDVLYVPPPFPPGFDANNPIVIEDSDDDENASSDEESHIENTR